MPSVKDSLGSLGRTVRVYVLGIILFGVAIAAYSVLDLVRHPVGLQWLILVALTVASGLPMLRIPAMPISFSISDTFNIAAALLFVTPAVPLLFMGEEYGETAPFQYFTSFIDRELSQAVRRGRAAEFSRFAWTRPIPAARFSWRFSFSCAASIVVPPPGIRADSKKRSSESAGRFRSPRHSRCRVALQGERRAAAREAWTA